MIDSPSLFGMRCNAKKNRSNCLICSQNLLFSYPVTGVCLCVAIIIGLLVPEMLLSIAVERETGPTNTRHPPKVGSMLAQRRRQWANIEPTLGERLIAVPLSNSLGYHRKRKQRKT